MSGFVRDLHHVLTHLEAAQRVARLASWELDVALGTLTWTPNLSNLLAVSTDEPLTLDTLIGAFVEDDRPALRAGLDAALAGEEPEPLVLRARDDGVEVRLLHLALGVVRNSSGTAEFVQGTVVDRTEAMRRLRNLEDADARRRELAQTVLAEVDEHRARVAADLHDGPIQQLTVAALRIELASLDDEVAAEAASRCRDAVVALRDLLVTLEPAVLRHGGAEEAFAALLRRTVGSAASLRCEVRADPHPEVLTGLLRLAADVLTPLGDVPMESVSVHYRSHEEAQILDLDLLALPAELPPAVEATVRARAAVLGGVVSSHGAPGTRSLRVRVSGEQP